MSHTNHNIQVSLIVVNYRSREALWRCIESFMVPLEKEGITHEWVIVNNSPDEYIPSSSSQAMRVLVQEKNIGYGAAINRGAKEARGRVLCILNPDTIYHEGALKKLFILSDYGAHPVIVGPKIIDVEGREQEWTCGEKLHIISWFRNKALGGQCQSYTGYSHTKNKNDWVSGAFLVCPTSIFRSIGGFDEQFFMYFEDMDLCVRARQKQNVYIVHSHDVCIEHVGGVSFGADCKHQKRLYYTSFAYYVNKHLPFWQRHWFGFVLSLAQKRL